MDGVAEVEYAVSLDDCVWIAEHELAVGERSEEWLPVAEYDGHDVDRNVIDEVQSKGLAADVSSGDADVAIAGQVRCEGHCVLDRGHKLI